MANPARVHLTPDQMSTAVATGRLDLTRKNLTALPDEIFDLPDLTELILYDNRLTALPARIGELKTLTKLVVQGNRLRQIPPEIGELTDLRMLALGDNRLAGLPDELWQLTNLTELLLSDNQLTELPPDIARLASLSRLDLSYNELLALPRELGRLTNLQILDLTGNQIATIPPDIGKLTNLLRLSFGSNRLTLLPSEVGQLANLRELDLQGNLVTTLPAGLAHALRRGMRVVVRGNPLQEPLPELLARSTDAVATYLESLETATAQYEAKMILIGEGNVGKTSLAAALDDAPFVADRPTTHGIEVRSLAVPHPITGADMTLRAWDFGGQEVYRATHQFFFSRRALYLVVWNAREGQEQNEVEGWLRRIRIRVGNDARVLIVATHCDERRPELDYPHLEQIFGAMLHGRYSVDNASGNGISTLRLAIAEQAASLPHMGQLLSSRWIAARDEVLAHAGEKLQIAYAEFVRVCQKHQMTEEEASTLADLLHDLGQIIYYGDDDGLREFVVLNPEWLTKAIGYVLEDEATRQAQGVLDHARLRDIWRKRPDWPAYTTQFHPYFLRLMEKFDVSYRLEGPGYRSLVAQLVPYERPALRWGLRTPVPPGQRALTLVCETNEPAPGLMAWLTVRHHRASVGRHWRTGVFLRNPVSAYDSEALVELTTDRQLVVQVRAPSPDLFFNVIRDSIEDLLHRWPGMTYRLYIPCPTSSSVGKVCPERFSLDGLLRLREHGHTTRTCEGCVIEYDISYLLTGFALPSHPLKSDFDRLSGEIRAVGRGVDELRRYAADIANAMHLMLKAVAVEVDDCPRLFTVTDASAGVLRRRHHRVTLWCEHPGQWHVVPEAVYEVRKPPRWLLEIAPYANLVFKALRLAFPVASRIAAVVFSEEQFKQSERELQLMEAIIDRLPPNMVSGGWEIETPGAASKLTLAEGQALRALRQLLREQDPARGYGALRRAMAETGEFLWVCPRHYAEYDPGLPTIPGA
ncbi:COR domain-containing protein [Phytohabitans kaempferiae]|uniref:non-specific serine/threonine protein kinase n=1 Tax=Phytohabitans kaempferiae TaxID=1620943 RepID=A0ABV6M8I4_9ACTN